MVIFLKVYYLVSKLFKLISYDTTFPVESVWLKVMGKHTFPVAFYCIVYRVPVPVFNHICTICDMTYCLETQLAGIWQPRMVSGCFCLKDEIVGPFKTSCDVSTYGYLTTGKRILGRMINITSGDIQALYCFILVYFRLEAK